MKPNGGRVQVRRVAAVVSLVGLDHPGDGEGGRGARRAGAGARAAAAVVDETGLLVVRHSAVGEGDEIAVVVPGK